MWQEMVSDLGPQSHNHKKQFYQQLESLEENLKAQMGLQP